jgi:maleylpyruvate isomerase
MSANPGGLRLFNFYRSSASYRVRIALAWKGLSYEYVPVSLLKDGGEHLTEAYRAVNPLQAVPTLEVDGRPLSESLAIIEYLNDVHPAPPLLPQDPFARAQARRLAEAINAGIQPLQNPRVAKRLASEFHADEAARKAWAAHFNVVGLTALETLVQASAGTCCVGDEVSVADVCLVPQLFGARRFGVDVTAFPTLARVEAALLTRPAFVAAHPRNQPDCPPDQR